MIIPGWIDGVLAKSGYTRSGTGLRSVFVRRSAPFDYLILLELVEDRCDRFYIEVGLISSDSRIDADDPWLGVAERFLVGRQGPFGRTSFASSKLNRWKRLTLQRDPEQQLCDALGMIDAFFTYGDEGLRRDELRLVVGPVKD